MAVTIPASLRLTRRTWPEAGLTAVVLMALGNVINRFIVDGKLPQPFIFDINDTFMDWFNTAFWAHNPGAFTVWRTVYPPLSFVFLKFFGLSSCYHYNSVYARDCDYVGIVTIVGCYVLGAITAAVAFHRNDATTGWWRSFAFGFGMPLLFTLERGNLILPGLIFFALAYGNIVKSPWTRAFAVAITINLKPYLLLPALAYAFRRDWRELERCGIATVAVYLVTYGIIGSGSPAEMASNTANWVSFTGGLLYEQIYYSTSFAPFLQFDTPLFPVRDVIPSQTVDMILFVIPIIIRSSQLLGMLVFAGAWLQPRALSVQRVATLMLAIYLIGQSPGGYTEVFLVFLLFIERWQGRGPIVALIAGYLLCVPYDYVLSNIITLTGDAWLSGRPVVAPFGLSVGIFLRPALIVIMFWALAIDSLARIVAMHRIARPTIDPHPRVMLADEPRTT